MANNYTQGTVSPLLPLTDEHLEMLEEDPEDLQEDPEEPMTPGQVRLKALGTEQRTYLTWEKLEGGLYYLFAEETLGHGALEVLQEILTDLDEEKYPYITVEYAHTCSKMRPDQFGGGAWFITRKHVEFVNTGSWLEQQKRHYKEPWADTPVQLARLICEINATIDLCVPDLARSMDLTEKQVLGLFQRAGNVFEMAKAKYT